MRTISRAIAMLLTGGVIVAVTIGAYFGVRVLARERPLALRGTVHASLDRESCIRCHAPIAAEWRESFHFRTVTGPFWTRVRNDGYADVFRALRVACMNCHAPANVLDLVSGAPVERSDRQDLGVDCVSCHVSNLGIMGPGRFGLRSHEAIADPRFRDPGLATRTICARCHDEDCEKTVTAWRATRFAREGVTCLHCHMPEVTAPSVGGGQPRHRRSHRFASDKDPRVLGGALNASLIVNGDRTALVRVTNDRVGHALPGSGMNELIVRMIARGRDGKVAQVERAFGTRELIPGYLDFWPFRRVSKIPAGQSREVALVLPSGHGEVSAEFRYRDWWALADQDTIIQLLRAVF